MSSRSFRSRHLRPPFCGEHVGLPCRNRHHAHSSGRIHMASCSSGRALTRPYAARGVRARMTLPLRHESAMTHVGAAVSPGGRVHGVPVSAGMALVNSHRRAGAHVAEPSARRVVAWYVKRAVDSLIAAVALVLTAPIMALSALAIRREGAGPIIYSQVRVGLDRRRRHGAAAERHGAERRQRPGYGRPFRIYKLRSMVPQAEQGTGAVWCKERDPRITRVGNFLRKTHLDELPQLVNVLRGEMSIVGPRPERPEFVEKLAGEIPGYRQRSAVLPGITGLAQVKYRYDRDLETARTKLMYDLHYIRNSGLLFDIKIMAATASVMLPGKSD